MTEYGSLLITSLNCSTQPVRTCCSESGRILLSSFFSLHPQFVLCLNIFSHLMFGVIFICSDTIFLAGMNTAVHHVPIVTARPKEWKALSWMIVSWHTNFLRLVLMSCMYGNFGRVQYACVFLKLAAFLVWNILIYFLKLRGHQSMPSSLTCQPFVLCPTLFFSMISRTAGRR